MTYREFRRIATGRTYRVGPREAPAYERSPNFEAVDAPKRATKKRRKKKTEPVVDETPVESADSE